MKENLISVIIPIYNVEKYIGRCLDSVINQTYKNLEIILVNDGTPDNSIEIAEKYKEKDSRIIIVHQENKGLSEARNTGVAVSNGEYIAFLDSDDWLEPDAYEYLLAKLIEHDADISIGGIRRTSKKVIESNIENEFQILTQKEYAKKYFKIEEQTIQYYVWNKLYKRNIVENVQQPPGFYAEDVPSTFMYILNSNKIIMSDKIIYNYFINDKGLSAKFSHRHFDVLKGWELVIEKSLETKDEDYISWSKFNRKRADFALLTELALSENYEDIIKKSNEDINKLINNLKSNKNVLLSGPIPFNRKILIFVFSINYYLTAKVLNKIVFLKRKVLK